MSSTLERIKAFGQSIVLHWKYERHIRCILHRYLKGITYSQYASKSMRTRASALLKLTRFDSLKQTLQLQGVRTFHELIIRCICDKEQQAYRKRISPRKKSKRQSRTKRSRSLKWMGRMRDFHEAFPQILKVIHAHENQLLLLENKHGIHMKYLRNHMNYQYDLQEPHYQEPDIPPEAELTEADRAMAAGIEPVLLEDSLEHFWGLQDPLERIGLNIRQGPAKPKALNREQQRLFYQLPPPEIAPEVTPEKTEVKADVDVAEEQVETSEQTDYEEEVEEELPGAGEDPQEELERLMMFQQMFQQVQQQRMLNEMMSKQRMQMNAVQRE